MKDISRLILVLVFAFGSWSELAQAQNGFYFDSSDFNDDLSGLSVTDARGNGPFGFPNDPDDADLGEEAFSEVENPWTGALIARAIGAGEIRVTANPVNTLVVFHTQGIFCFASGQHNSEAEAGVSTGSFVSAVVENDDPDQQHALLAVTFEFDVLNELLWFLDVEVRLNGQKIFWADGGNGGVQMDSHFSDPRFKSVPPGFPGHDTYTVAGIPVKVGDKVTVSIENYLGSDIIGNGFFSEFLMDSIQLHLIPNPNPPPPPGNGGDDSEDGELPGGGF